MMGLHIFDRLLAAKTMMQGLALASDADKDLAGQRYFSAVGDRTRWLTGTPPGPHGSDVAACLNSDAASGANHAPKHRDSSRSDVSLLTCPGSTGLPLVVLVTTDPDAASALAGVVSPEYLWEPLQEASDDSTWEVRDARGALLFASGAHRIDVASGRATPADYRFNLFLRAEFDSIEWVFKQTATPLTPSWQGLPVPLWLTLVGASTLMLIAFLAMRKIAAAIAPLDELAAATTRFSAGEEATRVPIRTADEIGMLAGAFNDMSVRIRTQFDILESAATFDREILENAPVERLAAQVCRHLTICYPECGCAVAWLDPSGVIWVVSTRSRASARSLDEGGAEWREWQTLFATASVNVQHVIGSSRPAKGPLLEASLSSEAIESASVLRVVTSGTTRAVIIVAGTPDDMNSAVEVRHRLAVAFAARAREAELQHLATHDSLTGLLNRYGFHEALDRLIGACDARVALLAIDLDRFKDVNDVRGHGAGDELLCLVGERLRLALPAEAVVGRQGGDEFAIALHGLTVDLASRVAADVIHSFADPFHPAGGELMLGTSIGIALAPKDARSREELFRCADIALYAAKAGGRGRSVAFTSELDASEQARIQLETELRGALEREEFYLQYQPRVSAADGRVRSAEALIRWRSPRLGLVSPESFVPVAERIGLIERIGAWVIDEACAQMAAWRAQGCRLQRISVNVSPLQFADARLVEHVAGALHRNAMPPDALEVEVTENLLATDMTSALEQVGRLRALGVVIALDDFGTGYSSLAMLTRLPVDVMKIDRQFAAQLDDSRVLAIVRAIAAIAHAAGIDLVAEGVETDAQAKYLIDLGCTEVQGFLHSRALDPSDVPDFCAGLLGK